MNLILSYSRNQDLALHDKGAEFLGAAKDKNDNEVHVFQVFPLKLYQSVGPTISLSDITEKFRLETKGA